MFFLKVAFVLLLPHKLHNCTHLVDHPDTLCIYSLYVHTDCQQQRFGASTPPTYKSEILDYKGGGGSSVIVTFHQ